MHSNHNMIKIHLLTETNLIDNSNLLYEDFLYFKNKDKFSPMRDFFIFKEKDTQKKIMIKCYNLSALMEVFKMDSLGYNEAEITTSSNVVYERINQLSNKKSFLNIFSEDNCKEISIHLNKVLNNICTDYENFLEDRIYVGTYFEKIGSSDLCYQKLKEKRDAIVYCKQLLPFFGDSIALSEFNSFKQAILNNKDTFNQYTGKIGLGMWNQYQNELQKVKNKNEILIESIEKMDYEGFIEGFIKDTFWVPWDAKKSNLFEGNRVIAEIPKIPKIDFEKKYEIRWKMNLN